MNANQVVAEISRRSWKFGVAVLLQPSRYVLSDGVKVGGYFCNEAKVLAVGAEGPPDRWLGILLHEYSHVTQWVEQQPDWAAYRQDMWDWLAGKRIRDPKGAVTAVQACEADCERRTIRLARELDAPIDLDRYGRAANSYLHFHNVLRDTRKWYADGSGPYNSEEILSLCNPTIDRDLSKTPPKLYKALLGCI